MKHIVDAMRRDTAATSMFGLGVVVIRFGMLRLVVYAWRSFGGSSRNLADVGRLFVRTLFVSCTLKKKHLQGTLKNRVPKTMTDPSTHLTKLQKSTPNRL